MRFKKWTFMFVSLALFLFIGFGLSSCGGGGGSASESYSGAAVWGDLAEFTLDGDKVTYTTVDDEGIKKTGSYSVGKYSTEYSDYIYQSGDDYLFMSNILGLVKTDWGLLVGFKSADISLYDGDVFNKAYSFVNKDGSMTQLTILDNYDYDTQVHERTWSDSRGGVGYYEVHSNYAALYDSTGDYIYNIAFNKGDATGIIVDDIKNDSIGFGIESGRSADFNNNQFDFWYYDILKGQCFGKITISGYDSGKYIGTYKERCSVIVSPNQGDIKIDLNNNSFKGKLTFNEEQTGGSLIKIAEFDNVVFNPQDGYFMGFGDNGRIIVGSE
jgi:hypothetical protein